MNTPAEIMAALAGVFANVTNLSADCVSVNDWAVQNKPYSLLIFPSLGGQQRAAYAESYEQAHRITLKLTVTHKDKRALYDNSAAMIPLVLAALRANDTLGLSDVLTCHLAGSPVTWDSPTGDTLIADNNGVLSREIDFTVTVWTVGD